MDVKEILSPAVWGILGSALTGFIGYRTASNKNKVDSTSQRMTYIDSQIQNLLDSYQKDMADLKAEVKILTEKNQQLVEEILMLKAKIVELEGVASDTKIKAIKDISDVG